MTKAELISHLANYPDDACIEVVRYGEHFDIHCIESYDDNGVPIAELGIFKPKTVPESVKRANG